MSAKIRRHNNLNKMLLFYIYHITCIKQKKNSKCFSQIIAQCMQAKLNFMKGN